MPGYSTVGELLQGWNNWLSAAVGPESSAGVVHFTSTYVISLNCAIQGLGAALGHDILCATLIEEGRLERPFDLELPMKETYFLVMPPHQTMTDAGRLFRDWLLSQFE